MVTTNKVVECFCLEDSFFPHKVGRRGREERGRETKKGCVWLTVLNEVVI